LESLNHFHNKQKTSGRRCFKAIRHAHQALLKLSVPSFPCIMVAHISLGCIEVAKYLEFLSLSFQCKIF
jgi:predicted alpha/beta hydrolase family esterase